MGASIPGYPNIDRTKKEFNSQRGLNACRQLNIETYVTPKELSDSEVEPIAVMATVVQFKYAKPIKTTSEKIKVFLNDLNGMAFVGKSVVFKLKLTLVSANLFSNP